MDKRDNLEAKVNAICDLLALSFMINEEVCLKEEAVKNKDFEKAANHRAKEMQLKGEYDLKLAQFPLLNSDKNVQVSDTTEADSSTEADNIKIHCGLDEQQCQQECEHKSDRTKCPFVTVEEAGIKNSPSWEQILEKEVTEVYPQDKFGDYAALAKSAFEKGMNRAKDYYEKEVVEPLKTDVKLLKLALLKTDYRQDLEQENNSLKQMQIRLDSELESLQEENERLKEVLQKVKGESEKLQYYEIRDLIQ